MNLRLGGRTVVTTLQGRSSSWKLDCGSAAGRRPVDKVPELLLHVGLASRNIARGVSCNS